MSIYKGTGKKLEDFDLTRLAGELGVGEDPLHALIEVETRGTGFDDAGRVIMLFEPHKFYKHLSGEKRALAVAQGLAYPKQGTKPYPSDSYPRFLKAMQIDETAAFLSCSWGMPQIMGENFEQAGYSSVEDMVAAFAEDEENQVAAMVAFLKANHIDDDLRRIEAISKTGRIPTAADWVPVVRPYNGKNFAINDYHNRAARAYAKWLKIKDTELAPSSLKKAAAVEIVAADTAPTVEDAHAAQQVVDTPTVLVEAEKANPAPPPSVMTGIKSHITAAIAFLSAGGSAIIGWVQGASSTLIISFFVTAAIIAIVYMTLRFWMHYQENKLADIREQRAHELTLLKMKSAMSEGPTVELVK